MERLAVPTAAESADEPPESIEYERRHAGPIEVMLRRLVAWGAVIFGAARLGRRALHFLLATGSISTPPGAIWRLPADGAAWTFYVCGLCSEAALLSGGVLLLSRNRLGVRWVQVGAAGLITVAVTGRMFAAVTGRISTSAWSAPGTATMELFDVLDRIWEPLFLLVLASPPIVRRIIDRAAIGPADSITRSA